MIDTESIDAIAQLTRQGDLATAGQKLDALASTAQDSAKWWLLRGQLATQEGLLELAAEYLEKATELDPEDREAMFGLAYVCDLHGDDERAVELYERCVEDPPMHVNAMINLAVMYEDDGMYEEAESYLRAVLEQYPNHKRASLFLKDVVSSMNMHYDEDLERNREKHDAVLYIPISDFELSVRSRNCLKKMDIHTLGDLLNTTEHELLSYKNFGETSLNEIKAMLSQKNLRLGQLVEGEQQSASPAATEAPAGPATILSKPVSELEFSVRARKCLQRLGIITLGDMVTRTEVELLSSKNFGETSLQEVRQRLAEQGLALRTLTAL